MGTQTITATPSVSKVTIGQKFSVTIMYSATDPTLTGLGLRMHYDARQMMLSGVHDVLAMSHMGTQGQSGTDPNNPQANRFLLTAWADWNSNWTGTVPVMLYWVNFLPQPGFTGTTISFSAVSQPPGFTLVAPPLAIV